jgi:hypothetical protein
VATLSLHRINSTTAQSTNTAHDVMIAGCLHHAAEAAMKAPEQKSLTEAAG